MHQHNMRVFAKARPGAIAMPVRTDVAALSKPDVFDRWNAGVRAVATGDNVITMYDVVGEDFWSGGGITAKKVSAQLRAIGDRDVEIHLNSPGGDMFEGIAIYNLLREHPQKVTVKVMGMAASAASIIAMAGDTIEMGPASFIMIHNCWVMAMGNRHDMAETAAFLEPFDRAMADVYATRTGQAVADIEKWMDAETYMSGTQAIERGFADALLASDSVTEDKAAAESAAKINAVRQAEIALCGSMSRSEARSLIAKIKGTPGAAQDPATPGAGEPNAADLQRLIETLSSK